VSQKSVVGERSRAATRLNDNGAVRFARGFHNGLDLLHVIYIQSSYAVSVLGGVIEKLA
jgi:hypothetical protein